MNKIRTKINTVKIMQLIIQKRFMNVNRMVLMFSVIFLLQNCLCSNEPDEKYVKKQFYKRYKSEKLMKIENTEVSPPCFYWNIEYLDSAKNLKEERWQYI